MAYVYTRPDGHDVVFADGGRSVKLDNVADIKVVDSEVRLYQHAGGYAVIKCDSHEEAVRTFRKLSERNAPRDATAPKRAVRKTE